MASRWALFRKTDHRADHFGQIVGLERVELVGQDRGVVMRGITRATASTSAAISSVSLAPRRSPPLGLRTITLSTGPPSRTMGWPKAMVTVAGKQGWAASWEAIL
jgi:hypothetical protein